MFNNALFWTLKERYQKTCSQLLAKESQCLKAENGTQTAASTANDYNTFAAGVILMGICQLDSIFNNY